MKTAAAGGCALSILLAGLAFWSLREAPPQLHSAAIPLVKVSATARVFAAGDMMFDREIRSDSTRYGEDYLFACIGPLIQSADFAVANLEGPITATSSRSEGSIVGSTDNYYFTFPATTGALLARHGIGTVDIGNNHILNFGVNGLISTQQNLTDAGVGYFGGIKGNEEIYRTNVRGVSVAFLGYNEFGGSTPQAIAQLISQEVLSGYRVIVYTHWGDEYIDSTERLRPIATLFAQAGAAAVIGSHPHVVLGKEYIGDTLIYYSLGNFIFDQYFDDSVDHGLSLILSVPKNGRVTAEEHPVTLKRGGQTCPTI